MTHRDPSRRLIPVAATLTAVGVAVLGFSASGRRPALASPAPTTRHLSESAESCRLGLGDQVKAIKAFGEMMPVFKHPRCINCHGALDVYSDKHPGASAVDEGLDLTLLTRELRDSASRQQCETCHDNIERKDRTSGKGGWMIPNPPVFFVDKLGKPKSNEDLCLQMKAMEETSDSFTSHISKDHNTIQFIKAGFEGDRALGDSGLAEWKLTRARPNGTQRDLAAQASKWVKLLNGHWKEPPGKPSSPPSRCGCVMPRMELTMRTRVSGTSEGQAITGAASATVPLTRDSSGLVYRGEAPLVHGQYTVPPLPPGCNVKLAPEGGTLAVKEARLDAGDDGRTTIDLVVNPTNSGGTMTVSCPQMPASFTTPLMMVAQQWRFVHEPDRQDLDYRFGGFEMPAAGAASGDGRTLVGRKEMTRTTRREGVAVTANTTFELWSVSDQRN
jgi:hypothetical protein